jgi:hypothetical protein
MTRFALVVVASAAVLVRCSWSSVDPSPPSGPASQSSDPLAAHDGGGGAMNHTGGADARDAGRNPDPGEFGASCASGSDCESNVCFLGGKGGSCSLHCTGAPQCPPGADGTEHCNPRGYCRY